MAQTLNALWVGNRLSYIERMCLTSALDVGHSVALYGYDEIENAPVGIDLRDAREIMPREQMIADKKRGSYALGSDLFRLALQERGVGCYIDCDLLFLRRLRDADHIFGLEGAGYINGAILKLPRDCPIMADIRAMLAGRPIVPPWWPFRRRLKQRLKGMIGIDRKIDALPWGSAGPAAISYFAERRGLAAMAAPVDAFYPLPYAQAKRAFDPDFDVEQFITPRTITVHLWNARISSLKNAPPPRGSSIDRHCRRLGIVTSDDGSLMSMAS